MRGAEIDKDLPAASGDRHLTFVSLTSSRKYASAANRTLSAHECDFSHRELTSVPQPIEIAPGEFGTDMARRLRVSIMAQEAVERRTRRDRKLHHEIRALPIVSPAACLVKACCSATPMIAMAANT